MKALHSDSRPSVLAGWLQRTLHTVPTVSAAPKPPFLPKYDFGQGLPAAESFPLETLGALSVKALAEDGPGLLEYFDIRHGEEQMMHGHRGLRESIASLLGTQGGRAVASDDIMLTLGSAQALSIVAESLIEPGDAVIVEEPTFYRTVEYIERSGGQVLHVSVEDDDGLDPDDVLAHLRRCADRGVNAKMLYTISTFHSPAGVSISLDRRKRLLELAAEWGFFILEDYVYGDLRFEGEPLPSLFALDTAGQVIQVDSFSKTIAPGLRMGWVAGAPGVSHALALSRRDIGVSQYIARVIQLFVDEGHYTPHLEGVRHLYRDKRDVTLAGLREHVPAVTRCRVPKGSMYLWIELDPRVDIDAALAHARENGMTARPGSLFAIDPTHLRHHVRLAFGRVPIDDIVPGIAVFGQGVAKASS